MSVTPQILSLRRRGPVLGTRALGGDVAAEIREADPSAAALLVDFSGVEVASSPFLDELACAIRARIADHRDRHVVLARLNDDVRDTLELVLERRGMALTVLTDRALTVLGGRQHLAETLEAAADLGTFTAPELAERLQLKLPNLHQRLTQLEAAGALTRAHDATATRGRRHVFAVPKADELEAALAPC